MRLALRPQALAAALALVAALGMGVASPTTASATSPRSSGPPTSGFGSESEPMTPDHASGELLHPVFRFFNPCDYFGPQSFERLTPLYSRLDGVVFAALTRTGKTRLTSLKCGRLSLAPFGGTGLIATCTSGGHLVKESWGYHHGPGPIVLPLRHIGSPEDNRWQSDLGFYNIGWVRADVTVWWLCGG